MSVTERKTYVVVDELGMDPLRDPSFDAVLTITRSTPYVVTESDEFNLPLIASRTLNSPNYWWVILIFNQIADAFALKRGVTIKIPNFNELTSVLNGLDLNSETAERTVSL